MQTINIFLSAVFQLLLFSAIPLIWWFVTARKQTSFEQWIGLKKPVIENKRKYVALFSLSLVIFAVMYSTMPYFVNISDTANSQFAGQGIKALFPALIYAFLQTGLSEELFFRGFLTKRLVSKLGFKAGNFIQGILFGLLHGAMFFPVTELLGAAVIFIVTSVVAALMGWINEKYSGGSIVTSWLIHGIGNTGAAMVAMFSLI